MTQSLMQARISKASSIASEMAKDEVLVSLCHESMGDFDFACYQLDENGGFDDKDDLIFYNNTGRDNNGPVILLNDWEKTGAGIDSEDQMVIDIGQLPPKVSRLLFVVTGYKDRMSLGDLKRCDLVIHRADSIIHHEEFHLVGIRSGCMAILGCLDIEARQFYCPGITVSGDLGTFASALNESPALVKSLAPSCPNLLADSQARDDISIDEKIHQILWGRDSIIAEYISDIPADRATEIFGLCAQAWSAYEISQQKLDFLIQLLEMGADWYGTFVHDNGNISPKDLIKEIIAASSSSVTVKNWSRAVIPLLPQKELMPYVVLASQNDNDELYKLSRQMWILGYGTEVMAGEVLSLDLGL